MPEYVSVGGNLIPKARFDMIQAKLKEKTVKPANVSAEPKKSVSIEKKKKAKTVETKPAKAKPTSKKKSSSK